MNRYLMIFRSEAQKWASMSPSEMQTALQEWASWMEGLAKQGVLEAGEQLGPDAKTVTGSQKVVSDGPYTEAKETVGGYVIVKAGSLNEAVEHSKTCPVLLMEGIIEVRPIMDR